MVGTGSGTTPSWHSHSPSFLPHYKLTTKNEHIIPWEEGICTYCPSIPRYRACESDVGRGAILHLSHTRKFEKSFASTPSKKGDHHLLLPFRRNSRNSLPTANAIMPSAESLPREAFAMSRRPCFCFALTVDTLQIMPPPRAQHGFNSCLNELHASNKAYRNASRTYPKMRSQFNSPLESSNWKITVNSKSISKNVVQHQLIQCNLMV
jgi:hypothetical protein